MLERKRLNVEKCDKNPKKTSTKKEIFDRLNNWTWVLASDLDLYIHLYI